MLALSIVIALLLLSSGCDGAAASRASPDASDPAATGAMSPEEDDEVNDARVSDENAETGDATDADSEHGEAPLPDGGSDASRAVACDTPARLQPIGGDGSVRGLSVAALPNGTTYLAGTFTGSLTLGSTTLSAGGEHDAFVTKLNPDGSVAWVQSAGGKGNDEIRAIAIRADGAVFVSGGTYNLNGPMVDDSRAGMFVARYSADGVLAWRREARTSRRDPAVAAWCIADSLTLLADASLYLTGTISEICTFGATTINVPPAGSAAFLAKYTQAGELVSVKPWSLSGFGDARSVRVAADGSVYVAGRITGWEGAAWLEASFLVKYRADGSLAWGSPTNPDSTVSYTGAALSIGREGAVFVTGLVDRSSDGDLQGVFLAKYRPDGSRAWLREYPELGDATASGLALDADDVAYLSGTYRHFAGVPPMTVVDAFYAKVGADGQLLFHEQSRTVIPGFGGSNGLGVALSDCHALVVGWFGGPWRFGGGPSLETSGFEDTFVLRVPR